jgi:hypothetical protein
VKTLATLAALVALVVLGPATGAADPVESNRATYSIDLGSHVRWFGDTSAAIVSDDPLAGPRLTVGRHLTDVGDVPVGVFARWVYASTRGTIFQDLQTELTQLELGGGVRLESPRWWRLRGTGQLELGMARTQLRVTDDLMTPVDDHRWAPYACATLGGDVGIYESRRVRFGLALDVGYTVAVPVDLRALPGDRPDAELSIDTDFASIGKLDTRGLTYSVAVRGVF